MVVMRHLQEDYGTVFFPVCVYVRFSRALIGLTVLICLTVQINFCVLSVAGSVTPLKLRVCGVVYCKHHENCTGSMVKLNTVDCTESPNWLINNLIVIHSYVP